MGFLVVKPLATNSQTPKNGVKNWHNRRNNNINQQYAIDIVIQRIDWLVVKCRSLRVILCPSGSDTIGQ